MKRLLMVAAFMIAMHCTIAAAGEETRKNADQATAAKETAKQLAYVGMLSNGGFETGDLFGWNSESFTLGTKFRALPPIPSVAFGVPLVKQPVYPQRKSDEIDKNKPGIARYLAARQSGHRFSDASGVAGNQSGSFDILIQKQPVGEPAFPTEGRFLAYISTERLINTTPGIDGPWSEYRNPPEVYMLTGSSINQVFRLPNNASGLTFDIRLLTNDQGAVKRLNEPSSPPQLERAALNAFGGMALSTGESVGLGGEDVPWGETLYDFIIDLDPASSADAHVTANATAGGFASSSPWLHHSFDVTGLGGQWVMLTAYLMSPNERANKENRLLLDNVKVDVQETVIPRQPKRTIPAIRSSPDTEGSDNKGRGGGNDLPKDAKKD